MTTFDKIYSLNSSQPSHEADGSYYSYLELLINYIQEDSRFSRVRLLDIGFVGA